MEEIRGSYAGKILRVNLSAGEVKEEELKHDFIVKHVGGRGFGSRILYGEVPPSIDPFDPGNLLVFTPGALSGMCVPAASRTTVTTKSPLSGLHGDAHASGFWGAKLKYAGYDSLVVKGRASSPSYIWVDDGKVEIRDASHLWGKLIPETHKKIQSELGDRSVSTVSIGPAGEKKVLFANIMTDGGHGAHARCGVGAVMGSKNLKAIAVRGHNGIGVASIEALKEAYKAYIDVISRDPYVPPATKYGTPRFMYHRVKFGIHGAKNWRFGTFDWKPLDPEVLRNEYSIKAGSCPNCPICCRREMVVNKGPYAGSVAKVEWEGIARAITCGVNDPGAVIHGAELQNCYGLDFESTGDTIAFAMECYEAGLLSDADTGGLKINFGDPDVMIELIRKIAYREGVGDLLAEGTRKASQKIGRGAERFAIQIKGVEMSAADPRGMPVRAVSYATSTRGSDHLRSNPYVEEIISPEEGKKWFGSEEAADLKAVKGKGNLLKWSEDFVTIGDILGLCKFAYYRSATFNYLYRKGVEIATMLYNACTGLEMTEEEMLRAGERAFNVEKAFNVREGADREDDTVPARFFEEPILGGGPSGGAIVEKERFNAVLEEYYEARGWDKATSFPTRRRLEALGLEDIAEDLERMGKLGIG